jgi:Flp pilus assembly protein TadD/tetratricopeptide (TPR) repeat protein
LIIGCGFDILPSMFEDEKPHCFRGWMERTAGGRKMLAAVDRLRDGYHRHLERYSLWSNWPYRLGTWLVATTAFLLALAALAVTCRISWRHYRHYEEKRWREKAQVFLARGDVANAVLSVRRVLTFNPNDAPACRIMAELADDAHSPLALDWLRRMVQNEPTTDNELVLASMALKYQSPPFPLTIQILNELRATATNSVMYQVVAGNLAMKTQRLAEAEAHFEAAAKLEPTNELFPMSIAIVQLNSTNRAVQVQARSTLEKMRSEEGLGLMALRVLAADRLSHQDAAAANVYSRQLVASPHAIIGDQLLNLEVLRQLKSDAFDDRLETVEQRAATNATDVAEVAAWMQANGLAAESLDWLTGLPNPLLDQRPVQMALTQGYLQTSQWTKLLNIAGQSNWEDQEYLRLALIFRAWSQLGAARAADVNWSAALAGAAGRREALAQLLQLAESWQLPAKQEAVLFQMVKDFPNDRPARDELQRMYFNDGDTQGLQALYVFLHAKFPDNPNYKNNLAFTSLLLNMDVRQARQWAAELYAQDSSNPVVASTYAFALHLQGRDKQGLAVLQKFPPPELAQPSVALYYGLLLAEIGRTNQAMPWLQIARTKGRLLPEEQQLLSAALGKGQVLRH